MQQRAFDTANVCNISASRDLAAAAVWKHPARATGYGGGGGLKTGRKGVSDVVQTDQ